MQGSSASAWRNNPDKGQISSELIEETGRPCIDQGTYSHLGQMKLSTFNTNLQIAASKSRKQTKLIHKILTNLN